MLRNDNESELVELARNYITHFPKLGKLRILQVDDDPLQQHIIRPWIEMVAPEMQLQQVLTVDEAEAIIRERPRSIDALILDLRMPDRGGIDLLQSITADKRYFPLVIYSGEQARILQSQILPILREIREREAIRRKIKEGTPYLAMEFISKDDPVPLLLLEVMYRAHLFSEKHVACINELCERLSIRSYLESPDERVMNHIVEVTTSLRNRVKSFLARFESDPEVIEKGLNTTPEQKRDSFFKDTFTETARSFYLDLDDPQAKPLLTYTMDNLSGIDLGGFNHNIGRYTALSSEGERSPSAAYVMCMGLKGKWRHDPLANFPEKYRRAAELLNEFFEQTDHLCEKLGLLKDTFLTQSAGDPHGMGCWYGLSDIQKHLEERGITVRDECQLSEVYCFVDSLSFGFQEFIGNAGAAGSTLKELHITQHSLDGLPEHVKGRLSGYASDIKGYTGVTSLTFYDEGKGFDPVLILNGRYFEEFSGTGLGGGKGLKFIKLAVEKMGGHIELGNHETGGYVRLYLFGR